MDMFPQFIQSLVATGGCCAASVVVLCAFSPTAHALENNLALADALLSTDTSNVSELVLTRNNHPPINTDQPGGGTRGAGTR